MFGQGLTLLWARSVFRPQAVPAQSVLEALLWAFPRARSQTLFHTSPKSPADLARKLQTENLPTYVKSVFAEEEIRRFMSGGSAHWVDRLHMESCMPLECT